MARDESELLKGALPYYHAHSIDEDGLLLKVNTVAKHHDTVDPVRGVPMPNIELS